MKRFGIELGRKALSLGTSAALAVSLVPLPAFAQDVAAGGDDFAGTGGAPSYTAGGEAEYAEGEILVRYDDAGSSRLEGLSLGLMESQLSTMAGLKVTETVSDRAEGHGTLVKAEIPDGIDPLAAAERAEQVPGVSYAQPNYVYHLLEGVSAGSGLTAGSLASQAADGTVVETNDTFLAQQYSLGSWEDTHGASVFDAWKSVKSDETAAENNEEVVTVAVLDTGVYADHLDLKDQIWEDYMWDAYKSENPPGKDNFCDKTSNPTGDIVGHGTHVCGIAAATANNQQGIAGASYNAKLLPIKVFNDSSTQAYAKTEWLVRAYDYLMGDRGRDADGKTVAERTNTRVVNMSLGGYGKQEGDEAFEEQLNEAADAGILTVCAGGNGDDMGNPVTSPSYPGDFDACLSVTCLTSSGTNTYWSDYNAYKDISAPGVDILASYNDAANSYTKMTGTSMASPLVAGIAALLFTADPSLDVDRAKEVLCTTVNPLDPKGQNYRKPIVEGETGGVTGSQGCVDAAAAVEEVLSSAAGLRLKIQDCASAEIPDQLYTGEAVEPELCVTYGEGADARVLQKDVDYRVQFKDNVKVGTASVTVIGMGDFVGRVKLDFGIKYDFTKATAMVDRESYAATGSALTPSVHVALGGRLLRLGRDYEVAYRDNVEVGTATVAVTGRGDYLGEVAETFEITAADAKTKPISGATKRDLSKVGVGAVKNQAYKKGSSARPTLSLIDYRKAALKADVDYSVSYAGNSKKGFACATATARGGVWTGSTSVYFRILGANPSFRDVKASTKYASDIKMAVRLGLMSGKTVKAGKSKKSAKVKKFDVKAKFTRAEAAVALYSLAGKPSVSGSVAMSDVKRSASSWKALQWACASGMLATSKGKVRPNAAISQQDFANMLYRFGEMVGHGDMTVGVSAFFSANDYAKVSAADRVGVAWAADKGALALTKSKGKALLKPTADVTRSVAAHMLVTACNAIYRPGQQVAASDDSVSAKSVTAKVAASVSDAAVYILENEIGFEEDCSGVGEDAAAEVCGAAVSEDVLGSAAEEVAGVLEDGATETGQDDFAFVVEGGDIYVSGYTGKLGTVKVPGEVTRVKAGDELVSGPVKGIAAGAFAGKSRVRAVELTEGVESIGDNAFKGCVNLEKVTLPEGLASIGDSAFLGCTSLVDVTLPATLVSLGEQALVNQNLARVGVASGSKTFSSVNGVLFSADLKTLVCYPMGRAYGTYEVPEGTATIGDSAFRGIANARNKPLASVVIPESVTAIGAHAFRDADGVLELQVPASVKAIGECAFADMNALKALVLPAGIEEIPAGFAQRSLKLVDFKLPASVKTIGDDAFRDTNIWGVSLPEGLTSIGAHAFAGCKKMAGLSLPSTLESMGDYAFQNCAGVTAVNLGDTKLSAIARGAFSGCTGLASVEVPAGVDALGEECFWGCTSLASVTFSDSVTAPCRVTEIPRSAFTNDPIESLVIPASVSSIGANAFAANGDLVSLVVQNAGEWSMGEGAFERTNPADVYGYRGSSTWKHFPSESLRSIDVENDVPLAGVYRAAAGSKVKLRTMVVSESGFVSLQWTRNGAPVAGATGGVLEVGVADAGDYALVATNDLDPLHPVAFSTKVATFEELPVDIAGAMVEVARALYTGKAVEPAVSVTFGGDALVEGVDYTLSYSDNVKAGDAGRVMLVGTGEFKGTKEVAFAIEPQEEVTDAGAGGYAADVKEAAARGLMSPVSEGAFKPMASATRGQVAAALYRVANGSSAESEAAAVKWAVSKGVFGSAGNVAAVMTRQELAVALHAFAKATGVKTTSVSAAAFLGLADYNAIAASARTAVIFTSARGILGAAGDGKAKKFAPYSNATRAELAHAVVALDDLV